MKRAFGSLICRHTDSKWLYATTNEVAKRYFGGNDTLPYMVFSSISPTIQHNQEGSGLNSLSSMPDITLHSLPKWCKIEESVCHHITRYHEEVSRSCQLELCDDNLQVLESVHRAIKHARLVEDIRLILK